MKNKIKFIDLFAGIGGFHLALNKVNGECVFASEWDKECQKIYEKNCIFNNFFSKITL